MDVEFKEKRIKKKTAMSCHHLKRNNGLLNGWMILKFELGISNTLMHSVSKVQLDPTVALGDMGLQSGLIWIEMSENILA